MGEKFDFNSFKNMSCGSFLDYLLSINGTELSVLALGIGYLLSNNLDTNKQNSLGNFFELIGQLLLTISAQNMVFESPINHIELLRQIQELRFEIERIKKAIL